jgi:thiamine pyrophosphokinase
MRAVVFVVAGGELGDPGFLRDRADAVPLKAVICADGGARHLDAAGIVPEIVVGDMDSIDSESLARYEAKGSRVVRYPQRKNETDTELALDEAFRLKPEEVWIWGALGRRVDHALANISLLLRGKDQGIEVRLIDEWCEMFLIHGRKVIEGEPGQTVSVLPFAGTASGITMTGFEYPLTNAVMALGRPYGISNRLIAESGIIEVNSGMLLAVTYFRPGIFPGETGEGKDG